MHMPSLEQIQAAAEVFAACAVGVGLIGTGLETIGDKLKVPTLTKIGRALEDFATNVPRLLGKEKPRS